MSADDGSPGPKDPAHRKRAVVDRIEGGFAVLLVGEREQEHHVPAADLPTGAGEGSWLTVYEDEDGLHIAGVDGDVADEKREAVRELRDRLRDRGGRFSR